MATTSLSNKAASNSSLEALWTLIMQKSKNTRQAIMERLVFNNTKLAEQMLIKASIEKGWQEVKAIKNGKDSSGTLQDLIDNL